MSSKIESAAVKELRVSDSDPDPRARRDEAATPCRRPRRSRQLAAVLRTVVALCLATTVTHVVLVFLHVAPPNAVSKRYGPQINAWVYPLFEQNWRLFAPDPDSVNRRILARTARTAPDGATQVSSWVDLTSVDNSAVKHNVFPSHTTQNLLRRAWTSYVDTHGADDRTDSDRAVMMQKYLRNIAADRVAAHDQGATFGFIQLRVLTLPVAAQGAAAGNRPPTPAEERLLPWWKVTPRGN